MASPLGRNLSLVTAQRVNKYLNRIMITSSPSLFEFWNCQELVCNGSSGISSSLHSLADGPGPCYCSCNLRNHLVWSRDTPFCPKNQNGCPKRTFQFLENLQPHWEFSQALLWTCFHQEVIFAPVISNCSKKFNFCLNYIYLRVHWDKLLPDTRIISKMQDNISYADIYKQKFMYLS